MEIPRMYLSNLEENMKKSEQENTKIEPLHIPHGFKRSHRFSTDMYMYELAGHGHLHACTLLHIFADMGVDWV